MFGNGSGGGFDPVVGLVVAWIRPPFGIGSVTAASSASIIREYAAIILECPRRKVVGKPYEGEPHVRFDAAGDGNLNFCSWRHLLTLPQRARFEWFRAKLRFIFCSLCSSRVVIWAIRGRRWGFLRQYRPILPFLERFYPKTRALLLSASQRCLQSLRMLWVRQTSFHSPLTFSKPLRRKARIPLASLICPKTASMVSFRLE
jgi:hypothetical protein